MTIPHASSKNAVPPTFSDVADGDASTAGPSLRHRANATFLMLARNSDVDDAVHAVRSIEDRFNRRHNYPWVFLNEEPFSDDFKRCAASHSSFNVS